MFEERRPVFSFEFFPPKTDEGQRTLEGTLAELKEDQPEYVSVTYGAGGSTRERTVEITKWLKQDLGIEAMAHLSCVGESKERVAEILEELAAVGIENVLALRGDPPRGQDEWTPHPRRPALLHRADRADPRALRLLRGRRLLPGGAPGGARPGHGPALREAEGGRRRGLPDHPAVPRQRALLRLRGRRPRRRHHGADHPGHHADHQLQADQDDHRHVRRHAARRAGARAERARRRRRGRGRAGRGLRDAAVLRPAGPRRPRNPLLHAEPLPRHARHPGARCAPPTPGRARGPRSRASARPPPPSARAPRPRRAPPRRAARGSAGR